MTNNCLAKLKNTKRCSRTSRTDHKYCTQHRNKYEKDNKSINDYQESKNLVVPTEQPESSSDKKHVGAATPAYSIDFEKSNIDKDITLLPPIYNMKQNNLTENKLIIEQKQINIEYKEVFNQNVLAHIIENKEEYNKQLKRPATNGYDIWAKPTEYLLKSTKLKKSGKIMVQYNHAINKNDGRLYAYRQLSLQGIAREIRHTIAKDYYVDIDMVNAHPTILNHLCKTWNSEASPINHSLLSEYVNRRENIIQDIININSGVTRGYIKRVILSMINGGTQAYDSINHTPWLTDFNQEIIKILNTVCDMNRIEYDEFKNDTYNRQAKFCNKILCVIENKILLTMVDFYKINHKSTAVLCFDGIMIPINKKYPPMTKCEQHIKKTLGIDIKLAYKAMDDGLDVDMSKVSEYDPKVFKLKAIHQASPTLKKLREKLYNQLRHINHAQIFQYNNRYCSDYKHRMDTTRIQADITCDIAPKGSGKTYADAKYISSYIKPGDGILLTTFRRSLVTAITDKFDIPDLHVYTECDKKNQRIKFNNANNRAVCQMESLWRIKWTSGPNGIFDYTLVVDEANQQRRQLTSETFRNKQSSRMAWLRFKWLVKNAKHVHLLDADLTKQTIEFFQNLRPEDKRSVDIFWNKYTVAQREYNFVDDKLEIVSRMLVDIKQNKKIALACNSKKYANTLHELIKIQHPDKKGMAITADTIHKEEVQAVVKNTKLWFDYDYIIYTPTIQSGVSVDKLLEDDTGTNFHTMYGIFNNNTCMSDDCLQMMDRIRYTINNDAYVHVTNNGCESGPTNVNELFEIYNSRDPDYKHGMIAEELIKFGAVDYEISEFGYNKILKTDYFETHLINECSKNRDHAFFTKNMMALITMSGATINVSDMSTEDDERKEFDKMMSELSKTLEFQEGVKITNVDLITTTMKKVIDKKMENEQTVTEDEIMKRKKFIIHNSFNIDKSDFTRVCDADGWTEEQLYTFCNDKNNQKIFRNRLTASLGKNNNDTIEELKKLQVKRYGSKLAELKFNEHTDDVIKTSLAMFHMNDKNKPIKYEIYFRWLQTLGFDGIHCTREIHKNDIKLGMGVIQRDLINNGTGLKLGKRKYKIKKLQELKTDDKRYVQDMMRFINGSLKPEFNISINKVSKHSDQYYIKDDYSVLTIFQDLVNNPSRLDTLRKGILDPESKKENIEVKDPSLKCYDDIFDKLESF